MSFCWLLLTWWNYKLIWEGITKLHKFVIKNFSRPITLTLVLRLEIKKASNSFSHFQRFKPAWIRGKFLEIFVNNTQRNVRKFFVFKTSMRLPAHGKNGKITAMATSSRLSVYVVVKQMIFVYRVTESEVCC